MAVVVVAMVFIAYLHRPTQDYLPAKLLLTLPQMAPVLSAKTFSVSTPPKREDSAWSLVIMHSGVIHKGCSH